MDIKINAVHFNASDKLEEFTQSKIRKLTLFLDTVQSADVFLRVDNSQTKENKLVVIKLKSPGDEFVAEKQSDSFEKSIDAAVEALRKQLIKAKGKNT